MSFKTELTRMWFTRSLEPFTFTNEYDNELDYEKAEQLGLYVHIPFCRSICNFCPYCKEIYDENKMSEYIDALIKEIHLVGSRYKEKKTVTSLYFGGGTPALAADRIGDIVAALKEHFVITDGIGLELHPDNVEPQTLRKLKEAGVTRISIGIQSFLEKYGSVLGRKCIDIDAMNRALAEVPFDTVSMDLIFALPDQTIDDLKADIDKAFETGANHVAVYPFIDFTFTKSPVKAMPKRQKRELMDEMTEYFEEKGFYRSSIWTFSTKEEAKYSSMTRENFLGFGCSATTLLKDSFKVNTFSTKEYCKRITEGKLPTSLTIRFRKRQRMVYYLFWTAYSTRVNIQDFEDFFGVPLKKMYGFEIFMAKLFGYITEENGMLTLTKKGAFYFHYYENYYTLSYIDKMWGLMRKEAFPTGMKL
ncbi:coproporphyrinogen-III oxidase family protein [Butyrivibrio sp. INlla16]|uniref:coproporphyrinogen-III oxidase family protein n=1 Tax=Butyrivibrio sp. INlla16 TaxID=1520807 RepID=UPI000881C744|nr:radical SAM protein [Butyrivibrio sp. INlla16]SDB08257.1 oxygen-independent coproporphyrinogen-3 oxidase [Butyrivibrio sp. INlla16]